MYVCGHEFLFYGKKNHHFWRNTHAIIPFKSFETISNDRV